jgi:hypothetical protein
MPFLRSLLAGRTGRAAVGGALVADAVAGIDMPGGRKRAGLFGSVLIVAVGVLFLGAGLVLRNQSRPFPDGVMASGTVTGASTVKDNEGRTMYARVVSFTTKSGQQVTVTEPSTSSTRPDAGEAVNVSYRPADPPGARIIPDHDWISLSIVAAGGFVILAGLGVFVVRLITLIAGIAMLGSAWRSRRSR